MSTVLALAVRLFCTHYRFMHQRQTLREEKPSACSRKQLLISFPDAFAFGEAVGVDGAAGLRCAAGAHKAE